MYVSPISERLFRGRLTPAMRATQPCLCLWRLFWHITSTTPWRRMILHFSHIGLTDGLTFMIPFNGWGSGDPALAAAQAAATGRGYALERRNGAHQGRTPDGSKARRA